VDAFRKRPEGPNSCPRQTKTKIQAARHFCSGRPASSSVPLLQPLFLSWAAGGPRAGLFSDSPQCRRIFSITSVWRRSMKAMLFISDPQLGQQSGADSETCLIKAAHPLRASRAVGARAGSEVPAAAEGDVLALCPRLLFEYYP
jgi:hypothetical protein